MRLPRSPPPIQEARSRVRVSSTVERSSVRSGQEGGSAASAARWPARSKRGTVCAAAGTSRTSRSRLLDACSSAGRARFPCPAASRLASSEVMNTVLPDRLSPVTARRSRSWPERRAAELLRGPGHVAEQPERPRQAERAQQVEGVGHGRAGAVRLLSGARSARSCSRPGLPRRRSRWCRTSPGRARA